MKMRKRRRKRAGPGKLENKYSNCISSQFGLIVKVAGQQT